MPLGSLRSYSQTIHAHFNQRVAHARRNKSAEQSEERKLRDAEVNDKIHKILTENPGRKPRWSDERLRQVSTPSVLLEAAAILTSNVFYLHRDITFLFYHPQLGIQQVWDNMFDTITCPCRWIE